jgi:NADH dehydrogenase (ubiquinone) 1 alpha subcomplex subunit 5
VPHAAPRQALKDIYAATLTQLNQFPETYAYRKATEALTKSRLELISNDQLSMDQIEAQVGEGPIEFVLKQAQREHDLVQQLFQWKAWEGLETPPPQGQWDYAFKQTNAST